MTYEAILLPTLLTILLSLFMGTVILFLNKQNQKTLQQLSQTHQSLVELVSKQTGLLAAKDPLAFQAIQAMESPLAHSEAYDPSDEAEIDRILARDGRVDSDTNGFDNERFSDLGDFPIAYTNGH
jgi:hypothetical protein